MVDTLELAVVSGGGTFLPKLIAVQFNQSPSWASILTGLLAMFV